MRLFWVSAGKEKATVRRVFLLALTCFCNSQWWEFLKLGCKHGTQISRWSNGKWVRDHCSSEIGFVGCGKRKGFGEEKRENENEGKKRHRQSKTDLTSLFIPRVHTTYYYSIYLFLIFYKKKLYFIPYQMNKSNIFFKTIISHYWFLYKNMIIFF